MCRQLVQRADKKKSQYQSKHQSSESEILFNRVSQSGKIALYHKLTLGRDREGPERVGQRHDQATVHYYEVCSFS